MTGNTDGRCKREDPAVKAIRVFNFESTQSTEK